jgi:FAD/FMN-containing dehydrogenase
VKYFGGEEIEFSVKSGGHCFAGKSVSEGNPLIDLSGMGQMEINKSAWRALVGPGVKWGESYEKTIEQGLAVVGGTVSSVGVSGFTLGGGFGYLSRKYGLAADNVISMEMVTAGGNIVRVSESESPELFWPCGADRAISASSPALNSTCTRCPTTCMPARSFIPTRHPGKASGPIGR